MNDETIYENGGIKVTREFLQVDNERCQIADIYDTVHISNRDWKGVLGGSVVLYMIFEIVKSVGSVEAFLIGLLFMAACIFFIWISYKGKHSLGVVQKTGTGDNMAESMFVSRDPGVITFGASFQIIN